MKIKLKFTSIYQSINLSIPYILFEKSPVPPKKAPAKSKPDQDQV